MHKSGVLELNDMYRRIEELCASRGINITQMCKEAGVARAPLTELKKGRTAILSAKNADKIASFFGVTVGYLLGNEEKTVSQAGDGVDDPQLAEFMELFSRLSPEQQARELAYLRELVNNQDKPAAR